MRWTHQNGHIVLFILAILVIMYSLITYQWVLTIIAIVFIALAIIVLDGIRRIENQAERFHSTGDQIAIELDSLKEMVESTKQDTRAIKECLERLEKRRLP